MYKQISKLIDEGLTNGQIAIRTGLTERNVRNLIMGLRPQSGPENVPYNMKLLKKYVDISEERDDRILRSILESGLVY